MRNKDPHKNNYNEREYTFIFFGRRFMHKKIRETREHSPPSTPLMAFALLVSVFALTLAPLPASASVKFSADGLVTCDVVASIVAPGLTSSATTIIGLAGEPTTIAAKSFGAIEAIDCRGYTVTEISFVLMVSIVDSNYQIPVGFRSSV